MPAQNFIDEIQGRLGSETVLLPCKSGKKGSVLGGWPDLEAEVMEDPEHRRLLIEHDNVAVALGPQSRDLVSIDIDHDNEVEPFLELNPRLRETLRTCGRRGCNVWLRIQGDYPSSVRKIKKAGSDWGEWRGGRGCTMIHGIHPEGVAYRIVNDAPVVTIKFDDIVWPEHLDFPPQSADTTVDSDQLAENFGDPFPLNQKGHAVGLNESFFAGLYATENTLIYEPGDKVFYRYCVDDGIWHEITPDTIKSDIAARILKLSREPCCPPGAADLRGDRLLLGIVAKLRGQCEERGFFDDRPLSIHLKNTMFTIKDNVLAEIGFSPDFRSRSANPIAYDPAAVPDRFMRELLLPNLELDDIYLLQKLVGMFLLGENWLQRFLVIKGPAECGKSQLFHVIRHIVGYAKTTELRTKHLNGRFELSRFRDKSLLIAPDVGSGFLESDGARALKGLVGGDWFEAERKFATESVPVRGNLNVIIGTNHELRVAAEGDADAWRRRIIIIPFKGVEPKKKIANFGQLLVEEEGPGILRWGINGLRMLLAQLQESGDIHITPTQQARADAMVSSGSRLESFLRSEIVRSPETDARLTVTEIVDAFREKVQMEGCIAPGPRGAQNQLKELMTRIFGVCRANNIPGPNGQCRGFRGVRFKTS